jgi:hypothetical protein
MADGILSASRANNTSNIFSDPNFKFTDFVGLTDSQVDAVYAAGKANLTSSFAYTKDEEEFMLNKGLGPNSWTEPRSEFEQVPEYDHYSDIDITQTSSGHQLIFGNTQGQEFVRLTHGPTSSFIEIQRDGTRVQKIFGNDYQIVTKNNYVLIKGKCNVTIQGDAIVDVQGDKVERVKGDYQILVGGKFEVQSNKAMFLRAGGDVDISTGGLLGDIRLGAQNAVLVQSDMNVNGGFHAKSIYSDGEVTAATGMIAGVLGSTNPFAGIQTLGGINCGYVVGATTPGTLITTVGVVAGAFVTAPLGTFAMVSDMGGFLMTLRLVYDQHWHYAPEGPTSSPISPDIGGDPSG